MKSTTKISVAEHYLALGISHFEKHELAEAIVALEKAKLCKPSSKCAKLIDQSIERIYHVVENNLVPKQHDEAQTGMRALVGLTDALGVQMSKPDYQKRFKMIQEQHAKILDLGKHEANQKSLLLKQVNWILELLSFIFENYVKHNGKFPFIVSSFLDDTNEGCMLRLKHVGNVHARSFIRREYAGHHARLLDMLVKTLTDEAQDTFANSDAKNILGKIFETIHQFPRELRGELIELLPWGPNSWYLMDFCASIFKDDNHISESSHVFFSIDRESQDNLVEHQRLKQFEAFSRNSYLFVDAALADIIKHDAKSLRNFFAGLRDHLVNANAAAVAMQPLTNLEPLIWYFKHTFQYLKLNALLPMRTDAPVKFLKTGLVQSSTNEPFVMTPLIAINLLTLQYDPAQIATSLKTKLSLIRRIQLIGEMYSMRNWGSQLKDIDYFDHRIFSDIRDGLCHIEDLTSLATIQELEQGNILGDIYLEMNRLRRLINQAIAARQGSFTSLPEDMEQWYAFSVTAWQDIKKYYQPRIQDTTQPAAFVDKKALETDDEINKILALIKPEVPEYNIIADMLRSKIPFVMPISCAEIACGKDKTLKANRKDLNRKLKKVKTKYNNLSRDHVQKIALNKAVLEEEKARNMRDLMLANFPSLCAVADKIKLAWANSKPNSLAEKSKEAEYALVCLQDRVILLRELLQSVNAKDLQLLLVSDVELLFSCHYLVPQIISIMNKLSSCQLLQHIHASLESSLPNYVALRNALEHTDAVIDSKDDFIFHMRNDLHRHIAEFIHDMMVHSDSILKLDIHHFVNQHVDKLQSEKDRHKQLRPLAMDGAFTPVLHRRGLGLFPGPEQSNHQAVVIDGVLILQQTNKK